jgi:hypothetical protein
VTELEWLRRLVEDSGTRKVERLVASGVETDFYVQNTPVVDASVLVTVEGEPGEDYEVVDGRIVRFSDPPPEGTDLAIYYEWRAFSDEELDFYLAQAAMVRTGAAKVYQAAAYAIDTLLLGAATALDFGAGAETYNMSSIFQRLTGLRTAYEERIALIEQAEIEAGGTLAFIEIETQRELFPYLTPYSYDGYE